VWAVGLRVVRRRGGSWAAETTPPITYLASVWGSGAQDVWAVGAKGQILHYDGISWSASTSGTGTALSGVGGSSSKDVWAVGGAILHWAGSGWSPAGSGITDLPNRVWARTANDAWAVSSASTGAVLHWDGAAWSVSTKANKSLNAVWGNAEAVWVGGKSTDGVNVLLQRRSTKWDNSLLGASSDIVALWGFGSDVWASDRSGVLFVHH